MKKLICLLLALCLLAGLFTACGGDEKGAPLFAERGEVKRAPLGGLGPAADADAVLEALTAAGQSHSPDWDDASERAVPGVRLEVARAANGDTVVTDGDYIYMLDSYGLVIFSAAGRESEILSYTRVEREGAGWSERLCVARDRVAVVSTVSDSGLDADGAWHDEAQVRVTLLDTADKRKPQKLADASVEGSLVEARLVDETLCLVTQRTLLTLPAKGKLLLPELYENGKALPLQAGEVYLSQNPGKAAFTVVAAVRLSDGRIADALAFTDGVEAVCGEGPEFYMSRTFWEESASAPRKEAPYTVTDYTTMARTEIKHLRFDGSLKLAGGCVLAGALPDPGAMSLQDGRLCLELETDERSFSAYTDETHGWTNYEQHSHSRSSQLTLLDAELQAVSALNGLGGEQGVSACRFLGSLAWMSTAGTDALFTADLSDPSSPAMNESLPGQGENLVLQPFGEGLVLGLAAPTEEAGWRLVMFDLSDPADPKVTDSLSLKNWIPAAELSDTAAFFTDPANCLIGFPAVGKNGIEYLLVRWTGSALKEKGAFTLEYVPAGTRGLLLNGLLYLCSPGEVYVADPETMKILATVSNAVG